MPLLPPDHPNRRALSEEVHARPPEPLGTPSRASYIAVLIGVDVRPREMGHIANLCAQFRVEPPPEHATQWSAALGTVRLKWERHGEFSSYTFLINGRSALPFQETALMRLPAGWLEQIPGATLAAVHAKLVGAEDAVVPSAALLTTHFDGNVAVGSLIGDGAAYVFTDFRPHADGFARCVMFDISLTPRHAGRTLQRLFEIQSYCMLALLALPTARGLLPRIVAMETSLAALTNSIAQDERSNDEALLHELTRLAAEVESGLASSQFRFGACEAYAELVATRLGELREQRLSGIQTIEEFLSRRFTPAVATCRTVALRMHDLSERVAQTSALLSTRVDITRERQNQALLASMDRRAKLQLRLQQTVEGLSVAAIVYYVAGLISYVAKALQTGGLALESDVVVGIAIPVVAVLVLAAVRRAKRKIADSETARALGGDI